MGHPILQANESGLFSYHTGGVKVRGGCLDDGIGRNLAFGQEYVYFLCTLH